jgi:signal transduction histidine kinase
MSRRLYLQIYVGFLVVAGLALACAGVSARLMWEGSGEVPARWRGAAAFVVEGLPPGGPGEAERAALDEALRQRGDRLGLFLSLWTDGGALLAGPGQPVQHPRGGELARWTHDAEGPGILVRLPDGRFLHAAPKDGWPRGGFRRHATILATLLVAAALGCLPLARRITRRVERLQGSVDRWGQGDLSHRAEVQGCDEVAQLAASWNDAASRIESLVQTERRLLAHASHELRSPLARLRMAVELLGDEATPAAERQRWAGEAERDVAELDGLLGDLLLAARLHAEGGASPMEAKSQPEPLRLQPLLSEEAERAGAQVHGPDAEVRGDPRLLRRLLRNLLENARRHAGGAGFEVFLEAASPAPGGPGGSVVRLVVADRGPGVPEDLRERIFEPFFRAPGHREGEDGGVGLGLSLVREIARHHGGAARCLAREGGGSRFEVDLPGRLLPG